jgi:hypothetical protein
LGSFLSSIRKYIRLKNMCNWWSYQHAARQEESKSILLRVKIKLIFVVWFVFHLWQPFSRKNSKRIWPQKSSVATFYNVTTFCERLYLTNGSVCLRHFFMESRCSGVADQLSRWISASCRVARLNLVRGWHQRLTTV